MQKLRRVGVIGAGSMGAGIAQKIAQEGCEVVLNDVVKDALVRAIDNIKKTLEEGVSRKIFPSGIEQEAISRIRTTTDLREMAQCQVIIEAVFEDLALKKELFKTLDAICPPQTIFATNTSTLSVKEMAAVTERRDRVIGFHFFFPPAINRLLEVIYLEETSEEAKALAESLINLMGKVGIFVTDAPGFTVNRFFVPWVNEGIRLLEEGVGDIPSIDYTATETFKVGMGPFAFILKTNGVPLAYHTTTILSERLSAFYGPAESLRNSFNSGTSWNLSGDPNPQMFQKIRDRLLGVVFLIAASLVDEGVVSMVDIDIGAKVGLRWNCGPFEMMNQMGIEKAYPLAHSVVEKYLDLKMPANFQKKYEKREPWDIQYVNLTKKGSVAYITIKRPEALNALNEEILIHLEQRLSEIESDQSIKTVVIGSLGKDFISGADISFFIDRIKTGRIRDIEAYSELGHEILNRIEDSNKLMIARVQGAALGGGLELALACHTIVASEGANFGFPETGIGICPGFGGTQRTIRKVGKPLAKYLIFTGKVLDAATARKMGLIEYVVPVADLDIQITNVTSNPSPLTKNRKSQIDLSADLLKIKELFDDSNINRLLSEKRIDESDLAQDIVRIISYKAPLAIKTANLLLDRGSKLSLKEALEMEKSHVRDLFSSEDALEGLLSMVSRKRPQFKGR